MTTSENLQILHFLHIAIEITQKYEQIFLYTFFWDLLYCI